VCVCVCVWEREREREREREPVQNSTWHLHLPSQYCSTNRTAVALLWQGLQKLTDFFFQHAALKALVARLCSRSTMSSLAATSLGFLAFEFSWMDTCGLEFRHHLFILLTKPLALALTKPLVLRPQRGEDCWLTGVLPQLSDYSYNRY
jgi:hypothetical protein